MRWKLRLVPEAEADLVRLYAFILNGDPDYPSALALPERALAAIRHGFDLLTWSPFSCRKSGADPLLRELVIPFGGAGYVALFEIDDARTVTILAVRHQREDDWIR